MARYNGRIIVGVGGKQQQADWNESDSNSPSFIKNKPNISGALTRQVVNELPVTDIDPNCIYMIPKSDPETGDYYEEWMYIDNAWEKIGSTGMAQVQSDWDETDPTAVDYIANKPNNLDLVVPFTVNGSTVSTTVSTSDIMSAITAGQGVYATLDGMYLPLTVFQNTTPEKIIFSEVIDGVENTIVGKEVSSVWTWELVENDLNNTTNDGTLTIQRNSVTAGTFTANQAGDSTVDIDVPVNTSDLVNDTDVYLTQAEFDALEQQGQLEEGKNYHIETVFADVATTGSYNDLTDKPTIPTVNDATITIQQNGTTVGTFTTNDANDTTINLTGGGDTQQEEVQDFLPLYFENISDSDITVVLRGQDSGAPYYTLPPTINLSTSNDNDTWTALTIPSTGDVNITVPAGGRTYIKGNNEKFCNNSGTHQYPSFGYWKFTTSNTDEGYSIYIGGNLMSILKGDTFTARLNQQVILPTYCFCRLFYSSNIQHAPKMVVSLPMENLNKFTTLNYSFHQFWSIMDALNISGISNSSSVTDSIATGVSAIIGNSNMLSNVNNPYGNSAVCFKGGPSSRNYNDLINKPTIPAAQVQSNWSEADTTAASYIQNKPTIPTCNNKYDLSTKTQAELANFYQNYQNIMDTNTLYWGDYPIVSVGTYTDPQLGITAVLVEYNPFAISSVLLSGAYHTLAAGVKAIFPDGSVQDASATMKLADSDHLATVATTGSYADLSNTPNNMVTGYNNTAYTLRYISESDYNNLGTYDNSTVYLIY